MSQSHVHSPSVFGGEGDAIHETAGAVGGVMRRLWKGFSFGGKPPGPSGSPPPRSSRAAEPAAASPAPAELTGPTVAEARQRARVSTGARLLWMGNAKGFVVDDLPKWRAFTGQAADEIQGTAWLGAVAPEDRERTVQAWLEAIASTTVFEATFRLRRTDGAVRLCYARCAPVFENDQARRWVRSWVGACTVIEDEPPVVEE